MLNLRDVAMRVFYRWLNGDTIFIVAATRVGRRPHQHALCLLQVRVDCASRTPLTALQKRALTISTHVFA